LVGLMLAMGLAAMDGTIVATAIPSIVRDLGGFALFPWVFSVYLLIQVVTIPIYGKLADLYGRKPVLLIGAGIFLLGSILSGASWNMLTLITFRGIQGIGAGAVQPIALTVVGDLFSIEERARIQGYLSSVWGIASIIGPAIGGLLVQYASWRWVFYINLPIGAAALWMIGHFLHEHLNPIQHQIDYWGSALLVLGMGLITLGLLEGGVSWAWLSPPSLIIFAAGTTFLWAFVSAERKVREPIMPPAIFADRFLGGANVAGLLLGTLTIGLSAFLPTFVQGVLGATPLVAGFALAAMSIGWPLASALSGQFYLRIGFRNTALLGALFSIISGSMLIALGTSSSSWQAGLASFIMGLGLGLGATSLLVGVQSAVDWNQRGVVTSLNLFARMVGSTLGVAVYGSLINSNLAGWFRDPPPQIAEHLPRSLNAATLALGGSITGLDPQALSYVRQGLYIGMHQVFWAILFAAVSVLLAEALMPRQSGIMRSKDLQ
jgi:EmrB/QacA subfamily drug resistance transporter